MKNIKFILLFFVLFIFSSCSLNMNANRAGADFGGVFASINSGDTWRHMSSVPTISGNPATINHIDVNKLIIDPSDSSTVYMTTVENGLYYTYNIGRGWNKVLSLPGDVTINDVAIDSNDKCTIYVALQNKLYKSTDCKRTFQQVYFDNNLQSLVMAVAVDHKNSNIVYLGTSDGGVLRSMDSGNTWRLIQKLNDSIRVILINPRDSRSVFVATARSGVYHFNSAGGASLEELEKYKNRFDDTNWKNYNEALEEFSLGVNFKNLVYSHADGSIFLATNEVIVRSFDEGQSWLKLNLLTSDDNSNINAIAINPKNADEIFYVTNTAFYRSIDGGETWSVRELPSGRAASSLLIDFNSPNIIYMGFKNLKR